MPLVPISSGSFVEYMESFIVSEAMFREGFIEELQSQTVEFSGATHETILLGCEGSEDRTDDDPRALFFWSAGIKGLGVNFVKNLGNNEVAEVIYPMDVDDAVTIRCGHGFKFAPHQLEKGAPKLFGKALAKVIARNMFDVGIACLYGALTSVKKKVIFDHTSSTLKEEHLHEHGDFSSPPSTWLTHSTPYSGLIKECKLWESWPKFLFSFKGGGHVTELLLKRLAVRDSDFLSADDSDGKIDKYRTIGLYDGGLAAFLDGLIIEMSGNVCRFSWNQSIAVKGFAWKGNADASYDQLHESDRWQSKTDSKEDQAGFIIETNAGK